MRFTYSLLVVCALTLPPSAPPAYAQAQRDRRMAPPTQTQPTTQPTPLPSTGSPEIIITPITPPPLRTAARQPAVTVPTTHSLEVLRARIADVLARPELAPAHFSIKVVSLDTGALVFEQDAQKLMSPASNMKLYTVAAALDRLGPDFHFVTSIYAAEKPDARGRIKGDLVVYGRGDPSFATRFAGNADYFKGINELAASIVAAGVKRIDGQIVGDESYFTGPALGAGWEWDDLQWYYAAPVSALTINDNSFDISVKPGARAGDKATITLGPDLGANNTVAAPPPRAGSSPQLFVDNRTLTVEHGGRRDLSIDRPLGSDTVTVGGTIPVGDPGQSESLSAVRPALTFIAMLRAALVRQGVEIHGGLRAESAEERGAQAGDNTRLVEIARRESPPFSEIAAQTLKPSQNLYAELILRTLGKQSAQTTTTNAMTNVVTTNDASQTYAPAPATTAQPSTQSAQTRQSAQPLPSSTSSSLPMSSQSSTAAQPATVDRRPTAELGSTVVRQFLREAGVRDAAHLSLVDGSGLARQDLISAESTVELLTYMSRHRYAQVFRDALPVAGIDGTLRSRFKNTSAANNLRAKTGTLSNVSSLSGYLTTASGERLAFSMIVNHYTDERTSRTSLMDQIALLLASFDGRTQ
jgi:D-alanyl-D-alanine carboxypeptidase/D-alanyl-D-alanine-endopeptidase (penicillin-binding protein 4)